MRPSTTFSVAYSSLFTDFYVKDSGQFSWEHPKDVMFQCLASLQFSHVQSRVCHATLLADASTRNRILTAIYLRRPRLLPALLHAMHTIILLFSWHSVVNKFTRKINKMVDSKHSALCTKE